MKKSLEDNASGSRGTEISCPAAGAPIIGTLLEWVIQAFIKFTSEVDQEKYHHPDNAYDHTDVLNDLWR